MGVAATVRFASRGLKDVPKQQLFSWDEDCGGVVRFDEDAIRLSGKRRMSVVGDVLTMGLAQPLLKRAFAKSLTVEIPIPQVEQVTFARGHSALGMDFIRFRVWQRLPDGNLSAHAFVVGLTTPKNAPTLDQVLEGMQAVLPAGVAVPEGAQPTPAQAVSTPASPQAASAQPQPAPASPVPPPAPPTPPTPMPAPAPQPPAWYPDPAGRHQFRYWSGAAWTDAVADGGDQSSDPM